MPLALGYHHKRAVRVSPPYKAQAFKTTPKNQLNHHVAVIWWMLCPTARRTADDVRGRVLASLAEPSAGRGGPGLSSARGGPIGG